MGIDPQTYRRRIGAFVHHEFVHIKSKQQCPIKLSTHPSCVRISLPAASLMFLICTCITLADRHCYSTNEDIGFEKHPRCLLNTVNRHSKELVHALTEPPMQKVFLEDYLIVLLVDLTSKTFDSLSNVCLGIKCDDILYRTRTRVNRHIRWLGDHRKCKVLTKTSCLHCHTCASTVVISLALNIQSVMNTTTELQYSDMFTSLDSIRKLSAAAWTALRLLLILSGIEPNPGPFNKADGASNPAFDEENSNPAYPIEDEEHSTIPVQAVDDVDGFNSFVTTSSSLSELPIPWSNQSHTQSPPQVQDYEENITPFQLHESVNFARTELDIPERYDQSEIRCNSSNPELSNTRRWRGEATDYTTAKYPRYAAVEDRTGSFRNWPRTRPTIPALVQSGFFYTGNDDLVRCFCCGIGLRDFSDTDEPLQEHVRHSRNCPYLSVLLGGQDGVERYHRNLPTQDPEEIRRQQRLRYNSQQSVPVTGYRARHERLRSLQSRLDTFIDWPSHLAQRPQELAEAGLYYTGVDDHCRCFACDGGLRKWEPGDDPWIEHCRWFPACPYAREIRGRDFIDLIQLSADQAAELNASAPQEDMTNSLAAMSMEDPLVQRIVDRYDSMLKESMGFSDEEIKQAVLELVQQGNRTPIIEDTVTQIEVIAERNTMSRDFQMTHNVEQTEDGMLEENDRLKGILMCCMCRTNLVNILFLPCTHLKVCLECSRNLRSCPLCKREIKDKIRTYML